MQKFTLLEGIAAPLDMMNVDTDMIIPKQFLKTITREGLGKNLFDELRYQSDGTEIADFILNKPPWRDAQILLTGDNFGCGSSREHAPWALLDFGIRCIIAPGFADIFFNNCFKNGILPITLPKDDMDLVMGDGASDNPHLSVNLIEQEITRPNGDIIAFTVDPFRRYCLMEGLDDIGLTLQKQDKIERFEAAHNAHPWA